MPRRGDDTQEPHRRMAHEVDPELVAERRRRAEISAPSGKRPLIERVGMAVIAVVIAALFGGVALAALSGGELFLGVMGAIGAVMTLWVGLTTLLRG